MQQFAFDAWNLPVIIAGVAQVFEFVDDRENSGINLRHRKLLRSQKIRNLMSS